MIHLFISLNRLVIPFVVLALLPAIGHAQENDSKKDVVHSPVGTWSWMRKSGESEIPSQLTIVKKDGKFTGKFKDKDHDLAIKNGKLKDGTFSFEVFPHAEKPELAIKFSGDVKAEKITGTMNYSINGEQSLPWVAKRVDPMSPVLGKWLLEFETPDGVALSFTVEAKEKGERLTLAFVGDDSAKFREVNFKDGVLSFETKQVYQEQPLSVEWDLTLKGNQATGTLYYSFDNDAAEAGEIEVTGERIK